MQMLKNRHYHIYLPKQSIGKQISDCIRFFGALGTYIIQILF